LNEQIRNSLEIHDYLNQQKQVVDSYLDDFLPSASEYPEIIHEAMRYSLLAGGKRLRPILALATTDALDGDFHRAIFLACALEMIHTYSLIHDDLPAMDNDDYRRGQLTCHKKFGEGIAILAGNALLTQAFQLLAEIPGDESLAPTKIRTIHHICRAIGSRKGVIAGQVVDLITQGKQFTRKELEYIHSAKTGALIEASVYTAAILAGADRDTRQRLRNFGSTIGLAFQIVDDVLDVTGSPEELGKASGKDTAGHKATYPRLYGLERSREIANELVEAAIQELSFLGDKSEKLKELAQFISIRRF